MSDENGFPPEETRTPFELPPEVLGAITTLHRASGALAEAAQPIFAEAARIAACLSPLHGVLQKIAASLQPVIESEWLECWRRTAQAMGPELRALGEKAQTFTTAMQNAEALGRLGWTLPLNAPVRDLVRLLLVVPDGREAVDAAFAQFYAANANEPLLVLLADLRQDERLAEFGALFEEVAFGLDHEKYRLVVTALIPLFEGVARRCLIDKFWKEKPRERFFGDKIASCDPDSFRRIAWSATKAFVEELYKCDDPKPLVLNRHWILHGRGPADASLVDALRLLQATQTVVSLADVD